MVSTAGETSAVTTTRGHCASPTPLREAISLTRKATNTMLLNDGALNGYVAAPMVGQNIATPLGKRYEVFVLGNWAHT